MKPKIQEKNHQTMVSRKVKISLARKKLDCLVPLGLSAGQVFKILESTLVN